MKPATENTTDEPTTADATDDAVERSTGGWSAVERRPLLKAIGVGGGLAFLGGGAVGQETTTELEDPTDIDPVFGLPLAVGEDVPDGIDPTQVVDLDTVTEENVHEGFPLRPDPQDPDRMIEADEEFVFDPVGLRLTPGDVVQYTSRSHVHTVTAFQQKWGEAEESLQIPTRIPDGVPGFHSPLLPEEASWLYEFTEPGVYDVFCLPHVAFGMVQRIVVAPEGDAAVPSAPSGRTFPNALTVLTAPELEPQRIADASTVAWRNLTLESGATTGTSTSGTPTSTTEGTTTR